MKMKKIKCYTSIIPLLSCRQRHMWVTMEVDTGIWPVLDEDNLAL